MLPQRAEASLCWSEREVRPRRYDGVEAVGLYLIEVILAIGIGDRQAVLCPAHPHGRAFDGVAEVVDDLAAHVAVRRGGDRGLVNHKL
jgi:hypothetical protein